MHDGRQAASQPVRQTTRHASWGIDVNNVALPSRRRRQKRESAYRSEAQITKPERLQAEIMILSIFQQRAPHFKYLSGLAAATTATTSAAAVKLRANEPSCPLRGLRALPHRMMTLENKRDATRKAWTQKRRYDKVISATGRTRTRAH